MLVSAKTDGWTIQLILITVLVCVDVFRKGLGHVQSELSNDGEGGGIGFVSGILIPPAALREGSVQVLGLCTMWCRRKTKGPNSAAGRDVPVGR